MKSDKFLSLDDFEQEARRFLPRSLFGYIERGVEEEAALRANRSVFQSWAFTTRVLRDISQRSIEKTLFGKRYAAPFGIAPMGIAAISAYRGDLVLAETAKETKVLMVMSGASLIRMEEIAAANPDAWFQAYLSGEADSISRMLDRTERAGFTTLVVTVDTQGRANPENFIRKGFSTPLRPSLSLLCDGLSHPRWLSQVFMRTLLRHGMPHFENSSHVRGVPVISGSAQREFGGRTRFAWDHIRQIRARWRGHLVIKGILSREDARLAREYGADGVILSNHGGRQLDCAVSAMSILQEVVDDLPGYPVMVDGGFRRGTDVIKALALGAAFVFVGRPFAYAAAVAGERGVARAILLLSQEVSRDMAMVGCTAPEQLDRSCLRRGDGGPLPS